MHKPFIAMLLFLSVPLTGLALIDNYNPTAAGAGNPEVHIKPDGNITVRGGLISQVVGSTFYFVTKWGSLSMNFTMKTDARTVVTKRYGGSATVAQVKGGDYIDVEGEFFVGSDFFGVQALRIKDWSLQEEAGTYSGVIIEVQPNERFVLRTTQNQTIDARLSTSSSVSIKKGPVVIPFGRLRKGDAVQLVSGVYDYSRNLLTADTVSVFQGRTEFLPHNFEGVLKQVVAPTVPATLVITIGGVDYTVKIGEKALIQKKNRSLGQLARFVVGDSVRFYGAVREEEKTLTDSLIVDAEVIRNLSL